MRLRRLLVPVLLSAACLQGAFPVTKDSASTKVLFLGDIHWRRPVGGRDKGAARLLKVVRWSNEHDVDYWILGGDYMRTWTDPAVEDSVTWIFADSILAPVYPIVGNWDYSEDDSSTGFLYENFTGRWPRLYRPYVDPGRRGSRWFGRRLGRSNICLFGFNNIRQSPVGDYYVNNPKDGSGVQPDDFDGISDSTSIQRTSFARFLEQTVEPDDWVVLAMHRTERGLAFIDVRPDQEGVLVDADSSQIVYAEEHLGRNFIVMENDLHEDKVVRLTAGHYTISFCAEPRAIDSSKLAVWGDRVEIMALADTAYTAPDITRSDGTVPTLVDSLGSQSDRLGFESWGLFGVAEFMGRNALLRVYLVRSDVDTITEVASYPMHQFGP